MLVDTIDCAKTDKGTKKSRYICKACHTAAFSSCAVDEHAVPYVDHPCEVCGEKRTLIDALKCPGDSIKPEKKEVVNHPDHYGGADNPYEVIKVINHYRLGFNLGNSVKYILRAGTKGDPSEDLQKARFYLDWEIKHLEGERERNRKLKPDPSRGA